MASSANNRCAIDSQRSSWRSLFVDSMGWSDERFLEVLYHPAARFLALIIQLHPAVYGNFGCC